MSISNLQMASEGSPSTAEGDRIQRVLRENLPNHEDIPGKLVEAMSYSLFAGGKRLRSSLVFAGAEAVGVDPDKVRPLAAAVEFVHTYSLIHDDLPALDNDDFRRGKPTCHRVFGEDIAIMAGDALLTEAFSIVSRDQECADLSALRSLLDAMGHALGARGMVGGQVRDLTASDQFSRTDLEAVHNGKTGALISFCMSAAAIAFAKPQTVVNAISEFGFDVGLAFQIVDDVIDETGTLEEIGKTPGSDRSGNKFTYTVLMSTAEATELAEKTFASASDRLATATLDPDPLLAVGHLMVHRRA